MGQISSFYRVAAIYAPKRRNKTDKKARKRKKMPYAEFLQTDYWKKVRETMLDRADYRCHKCKAQEHLQVHHISYEHRGDEMRHLELLVVLCRECHKDVHGLRR